MRKIEGSVDAAEARKFADYLLVQGILCNVEPTGESSEVCDLWVRDEDRLEEARDAFALFRQSPNDERFNVQQQAEQLRREVEQKRRQQAKLQKSFQPRGGGVPGGMGMRTGRATITIILICVVVSLLTSFGNPRIPRSVRTVEELPFSAKLYNMLTLVPMFTTGEEQPPLSYIAQGQVWRIVTPLFLHGSPLHLVFNCLFIYSFGRIIEQVWNPVFLVALFLLGGIFGNFVQVFGPTSLGASPYVVGASGGALALFTFLWLRPKVDPSVPFRIPPLNVAFILGYVIIVMLPGSFMSGIAHLAHLGGMIFGAVAALGVLDFLHR